MGTLYEYAIVHGQVLVWWTDGNGVDHSMWLRPEPSRLIAALDDDARTAIQRALRDAVKP